AYKTIFGAAPTDAKIHALIDGRTDYFMSYGADRDDKGAPTVGLGTKAAMVGWLLAEAEKGDLGVMARSNAAWLTDLADDSAAYGVNIVGAYGKPEYVFGG
ncbi:MAG: Hemolysin-type calcium-binding region, partial [Caulobacter sp.]|nr:Hemolysin-type calcium-binding region [Caulobacter sp.]